MLLLAGLHLLHLHVPVITTHLCTGWIGRGNDGAWMLLFAIAPVSSVSLTTVLAGGAVAGSAALRDIMEQQHHHCNSKTKIAFTLAFHNCLNINFTNSSAVEFQPKLARFPCLCLCQCGREC